MTAIITPAPAGSAGDCRIGYDLHRRPLTMLPSMLQLVGSKEVDAA